MGLRPLYGDKITCICAKDSDGERFAKVMTNPNYGPNDERELLDDFAIWLSYRDSKDHFFVTKNGKEFDLPFMFIRHTLQDGYCEDDDLVFLKYPHFDLQDITSKRIGLQQMAELLGCTPKSGTGANAIKLWKEGRYEELKAYCQQDVDTTEEVFLKWRELQSPVKRTHKTGIPPGGVQFDERLMP